MPVGVTVVGIDLDISGIITDSGTGKPVDKAALVLKTTMDGAIKSFAAESDAQGKYKFAGLPPTGKNWTLEIKAPGYDAYSKSIAASLGGPLKQDVRLHTSSAAISPRSSALNSVAGKGEARFLSHRGSQIKAVVNSNSPSLIQRVYSLLGQASR